MWERGRGVFEREDSKRAADKGEEGTCANMKTDGEGFVRGTIFKGREMGVSISVKVFVSNDEVGGDDLFAVTGKNLADMQSKNVEEGRTMKERVETGFR